MGEAAEKMDPSARSAASPAGSLVERLRSVHLKMVDAVLGGDGLQQVAALAAEAAGAPVAIVVPRLDAAVAAGREAGVREPTLEEVRRYVADRDVQTIVDTILKHARTGAVGDGKVFVLPVEESYRVRTGESGEEVLQAHPEAAATT